MPDVCWLLKATRISALADLQPRSIDSCLARALGINCVVGGCAVRFSFGMHQKNHDS